MITIFPNCMEAARRLSLERDGNLSTPALIGLRLHLAICGHCRRYARQLTFLNSIVAEYPDRLGDVRLREPVRCEIVSRLKQLQ
jgi:hypothetical protein